MGEQPGAERVVERFQHTRIEIEVASIIIHKADQPEIVANLFDADRLTGGPQAESIDGLSAVTSPHYCRKARTIGGPGSSQAALRVSCGHLQSATSGLSVPCRKA
jgi:hypothetical protein